MSYWLFFSLSPSDANEKRNTYRAISVIVSIVFLFAVFFPVLKANAAASVRKDTFIAQLFKARGFPLPANEKSLVNAALDYNLTPLPEGKLSDPVTRREAIVYAVHSLGLFFEPRLLANYPLPYKDVSALSPEERGALAVALNMKPPLLKKGSSTFSPSHVISPAEANDIAARVKAAGSDLSLSVNLSPLKGMTIRIRREGVLSVLPKWRAVVNGFESREDADFFRGLLTERGVDATVDSYNYDWRVRSPIFDRYGGVRRFLSAASSLGREGVVFATISNWEMTDTPRFWTMMVFDPGAFELRPVFPAEGMATLAPLSSMLRDGAVAVVNGGYFGTSGKGRGSPIGALMTDGMLLNPPFAGRTCFGWNSENRAVFGQLSWNGRVQFPGGFMELSGINRTLKGDGVVLFSPHFGMNTPLVETRTAEAVLGGLRVEAVRAGGGNPIPEGKLVLAVYGAASRFIESLRFGDTVGVSLQLNEGDPAWSAMTHIVQGGPFLLRNGEILSERETLSDSIIDRRHPRTVVGLTKEGYWFFFVGDGRNAVHSVGFTLGEVSRILKSAGASYALNLDGGGSSGIVSSGGFWNIPSDGVERPVSYGIGAFQRGGR